jgi:tRNA threonylcarbamoyladenosine biosynthesis protein TsaB
MNNGKKILSIDTSSRTIDVALSSHGRIINVQSDFRLDNYEGVVCLIESALKKASLELEHIDYFGACIGPGSFTGIRIGLSVMKALAYSQRKPMIGFSSLDLLAYMAKDKFQGLLCIMQDAKRNNIYSAAFKNNKRLHRVSPYLLCDLSQLLREIKRIHRHGTDLYFYGDAVSNYKDQIIKSFPDSIILNYEDKKLKGRAIISLTKENADKKISSFQILPLYMYPKDCQVRRTMR